MKRRISGYSHGLCFSLFVSAYSGNTVAAPLGGEVVGGTGAIAQSGLSTTINQTSQNLAIDWQSFNVNANEHVQFIQPNATSIALNRILSNNGSLIAGRIDANGQVILVNPNGIFFTPTARINVGGLIASGLDIKPADFMNGQYLFHEIPGTNGVVINSGLINASLGGNVALLGKRVENNGLIWAKLGSVSLAAGKQAVLTFDSAGLLGVRISEAVLQQDLGIDPAVINSGEIQAGGGRVLLTASVSQDVFSQAVNTQGIEAATSVVVNPDGSFTLGSGADVLNSGSINTSTTSAEQNVGRIVLLGENVTSSGTLRADAASGNGGEIELQAQDTTLLTQNSLTSARAETHGQGGIVKVLGDKVGLFDQAAIDVSGAIRGGEALIGGDQEGKNPAMRNADFTYLSELSQVTANGLNRGDGGRIITFAKDTARVYGTLRARGAVSGGDGGFIETSGLRGFEIRNAPDVGASHGAGGLWFIDPYDLTISSAGTTNINDNPSTLVSPFTSTGAGANLSTGTIRAALINGDVTIQTVAAPSPGSETGNITFLTGSSLDYDGRDSRTLIIDSAGGITFQAGSKIYDSRAGNNTTDALNLNLYAANAVILNGADVANSLPAASITTQGGYFHVGSSTRRVASFTNDGIVNTAGLPTKNGGEVAIYATGDISTTALTTQGGLAARDTSGHHGGAILLDTSGGAMAIKGDLLTGGSDGYTTGRTNYDGGNAGAVSLVAPGGITLSGNIAATGGSPANNGSSGNGGSVSLTGAVTLNSPQRVRIDTTGATLGNITFSNTLDGPTGLTLIGNDITLNGEVGATTALGNVTLSAQGDVDAKTHTITAKSLTVTRAGAYTSGAINTSATTGDGGVVSIVADNDVKVGGIRSSTSDILASGGAISLTAANVDLNGNINASGGVASPTAQILLTPAGGAATLNALNNFTTGVNITATDGTLAIVADRDNDWVVNGPNTGHVNANVDFTGMKNLKGAGGVDTFQFSNSSAALSGYLDGGGSPSPATPDTVDVRAHGDTTVQLLPTPPVPSYTTPANTVSVYRIGAITASAGSSSTLIATNATNQWTVSGKNIGSLNDGTTRTAFTNFKHLTGNAGQDIFTFTAQGELSGLINGGGGTSDILDLQAQGNTKVQLAATLPTNVTTPTGSLVVYGLRTIRGNDSAFNTVSAADTANNWQITQENAGTVNSSAYTVDFTGFQNLSGGAGVDNFTLSGQGSLSGVVRGDPVNSTAGVNTLRVTLGGGQNGQVNYLGNGKDSVTLAGGIAGATGTYNPDALNPYGSWDQLSYTTGPATGFATNYANVASVTDNATANSLTVNGGGNAFGLLKGNTLTVSNGITPHTAITYTGKANLTLQDIANVLINDNLNIPTTVLTVRNATTLQPAANTVITAGGLVLDNITATLPSLTTQVASLGLSQLGAVNITNTGTAPLRLDQLSTFSGPVTLKTGGNLTSSNQAREVNTVLSLTAQGDLDLSLGQNALSGPLNLTANNINLTNTAVTTLASVNTGNLTLDSAGDIHDTGPVNVSKALILSTPGQITLDHMDHIATGRLTASQITLHTVHGIGSGDYLNPTATLETHTADLSVKNDSGSVLLSNHGRVSASIITQGDIHFDNDLTVTLRQLNANGGGQAPAASLGGNIYLSVRNGSAYSNSPTKLNTIPDIVAQNFLGILQGAPRDMGEIGRYMNVLVKNEFNLYAENAYINYYPGNRPLKPNVNAALFEYIDPNGINKQLLDVDTLGTFDPAIFTAVRNYYYEDVAIRMPNDQVLGGTWEDDDAEEDARKRNRQPVQPSGTSSSPANIGKP